MRKLVSALAIDSRSDPARRSGVRPDDQELPTQHASSLTVSESTVSPGESFTVLR